MLHLSTGSKANRSFNYANLFFFPKDSSNSPLKQRPITVSNTDNRVLANVIRRTITPAVCAILNKTQKAFIPGSSIDDNINYFNKLFYQRLHNGNDYHLLLHDFEKAYDSISRSYLMALLQKIGIPDWILLVIRTFFRQNIAFPILKSPHDVKITMTNGLKQGCPLSPLFFIIALDPLLEQLRRSDVCDERAFCDDLGIGSTTLADIAQTIPLIEKFNQASGARTNNRKVFLVSSRSVQPTELKEAGFPKRWIHDSSH